MTLTNHLYSKNVFLCRQIVEGKNLNNYKWVKINNFNKEPKFGLNKRYYNLELNLIPCNKC